MRILIEAHHPAHIHFFKEAIRVWRGRGDDVLLLGRDRDVMKKLLAVYTWIPSKLLSTAGTNNRLPVVEMLRRQWGVAREVRRFRADVVLSLMGSYTQSARLLGVPNVVFTDSEHQAFNHRIAHPFATHIHTPRCFWKDLGSKQRRYAGYHELAFLHPRRFEPNRDVLSALGCQAREYVVVRTSAWNTLHDIGGQGLGEGLDAFLEAIEQRAQLWILPEGGRLAPRWESHRLPTPPEQFHDVLAFARLVVTEGASTASEAVCLGVPTVYINTAELGYLQDQERRYKLVRNCRDAREAMRVALEWLDHTPDPEDMRRARERLIADHVDVTEYVVQQVDSLNIGRA